MKLGNLRLRHKIGISVSVAALLPVLVASWVAVNVVLRSQSSSVIDETQQQLKVGLNLLLRTVERLGHDAARLSGSRELVAAFSEEGASIDEVLARHAPHMPASLIQVSDSRGELLVEDLVVGRNFGRFRGLGVESGAPSLLAGLAYERRVTIVPVSGQLVVRATAPIVDDSLSLHGAIVISMPLDGQFADRLKGALNSDVLIFSGVGDNINRAMATLVDSVGARLRDIEVPAAAARRVDDGQTAFLENTILDHEYTIGYAPLTNHDADIVGIFAVAVDRAPLAAARRVAIRSLALGAAGAFIFAIGLAGLLSRRITKPVARLHQGAIAIARGDLDYQISVSEGDEIGDLARAFSNMTTALKENQARLAARMREIVALHDAGRAVSSVIDLDSVLRKIVDQVSRVLSARVCAIWLTGDEGDELRLGASRAKANDLRRTVRGDASRALVEPLAHVAHSVIKRGQALRLASAAEVPSLQGIAEEVAVSGSLLAIPLERKGSVVGVIVVGRTTTAKPFSEADENLLATFADQAAAAIENASLYQEVRAFNEELEAKVRLRTQELEHMNAELGRAITEVRETQAQLVLSERLAGLGQLVAGVAHEINSPAAAIAGSVDAFADNTQRLTSFAQRMAQVDLSADQRGRFATMISEAGADLDRPIRSPALVRRTAKALTARMEEAGLDRATARELSRPLAELLPEPALMDRAGDFMVEMADISSDAPHILLGYLREYVYLHRTARTIRSAIRRIKRIVGGLKSYTHLDQDKRSSCDVHEGIENTLVILEHLLGAGIVVQRRYGELPHIDAFVDELNQVWTNLLHNAVQALGGNGTITVETTKVDQSVAVRIIDDGPGIPSEAMDKIFEPFYTTKPQGEGTGLGLRIVKQIVEKHGGTLTATSEPGRTCFEVRLPIVAPAEILGASTAALDDAAGAAGGAAP